ncbi:glycosyltransferase family 39 protein [Baaleninema sp.]|uniref:glycosyltransferase family 39 protein n=1 Tax=Baaleninema sp. TaxID=3101197 RepID=UPI003D06184F
MQRRLRDRQKSVGGAIAVFIVLAVGAALRFWHLDLKPLWLDEILTAGLSLGRSASEVPLDRFLPVTELKGWFSLAPDATCADISHTVATESTHPPLYFCLTHRWLQQRPPSFEDLTWQLRSLPAAFGVLAIAAMFWLDRLAFSFRTGLVAAALMAVSPFAVYLSQEARHYTLPLFLVTVALGGLVEFARHFVEGKPLPRGTRWGWVAANTLGLYVHYFFVVAYAAQLATLASVAAIDCRRVTRCVPMRRGWANWATFFVPAVLFLPWLPQLLSHLDRPETDWFKPFEPSWTDGFAPLVQTLASWVVMAISLPVENQPLWIAVPLGVLMVAFSLWLGCVAWRGWRDRWRRDDGRLELLTLTSFTGWTLVAFGAIVYGLGKDITTAPRYHFLYYPGFCALLAAALTSRKAQLRRGGIVAMVGWLSSILVVHNLAFHKPYYPRQIARSFNVEPQLPLVTVVGYQNFQEIALGLSFALELPPASEFGLFDRASGYERLWQNLETLSLSTVPPFELWVVAPGLRQAEYPDTLNFPERLCQRDISEYHRLGIPYQRYRCSRDFSG